MVDKYRITDSPKSWRLRNGVEVPAEYLSVLQKKNREVFIVCSLVMILVFSCGVFTGYDFGFSAGSEDCSKQISQLEGKLDSLEVSYWKQVTLSEYLAMETFDFETKRLSAGDGVVVLTDLNSSTQFNYRCVSNSTSSC